MRRLAPFCLTLAILALLVVPSGAAAQEDEPDPPVLRLSFFKCSFSGDTDALQAEIDNDVAIWRELVAEGQVIDHGYFYHWWADEWNMGIYTIAPTLQGILDGVDEAGERYEQRHGDGPSAVTASCPEHRDGFYTLGPSAAGPGSD